MQCHRAPAAESTFHRKIKAFLETGHCPNCIYFRRKASLKDTVTYWLKIIKREPH